jgi:hypothetical protein
MRKPTIRKLIAAKTEALKRAKPKSRDRLRNELRALQIAQAIKRECRAA